MNELRPIVNKLRSAALAGAAVMSMPASAVAAESAHVKTTSGGAAIGRIATSNGGAGLTGPSVNPGVQLEVENLVLDSNVLNPKPITPNSLDKIAKVTLDNGQKAEEVLEYASRFDKLPSYIEIDEGNKAPNSSNTNRQNLSFEFSYSPISKTWSSDRGLAIPDERGSLSIGENDQAKVIVSHQQPQTDPRQAISILNGELHQADRTVRDIADGRPTHILPTTIN